MKNRRRSISLIVIFAFILTSIVPYSNASAGQTGLGLPVPGTMVNLSAAYAPLLIKGLRVHPDNPLLFDFIVDSGNSTHKKDSKALRAESEKLIKYFLATLTIPEKDMWVNLSPYEQDRIIEQSLGETELGADMLAQDYILKQLTASLLYPEKEMGRKFWDKVYAQARERFGASASIPINTFNKVWILPDQADIVVRSNTAFVVAGHMKVMLEEDYLAGQKHAVAGKDNARSQSVAQQIVRDIVLPAIEREVNEGQNFAPLRQIFNSIVLASWYKKNLKEALLNQVYADQSKINGVDVSDKATKEKIYEQYLQAYKKGVFNYIKETHAPDGKMTPRKYFSGGEAWAGSAATNPKIVDNAQASQLAPAGELFELRTMIEQQSVQRAGAGLQGDERGWRQILTRGQEGAVDMLDTQKPQIFAYSSKVSLWLKALFARDPQLHEKPLEVVIKENIGIPLTLEQARQIAQVLSPLQELPQEPGAQRSVVKPVGGVKDSSRGIASIIKIPVIDTLKAREIVERLTRDDRGMKKVEWRNGRWEYAVEASAAQGMASLSRADLENREPLKLWIKEFRTQNTGVSDDKLIPLMSRQIYGDEAVEHLDAIEAAITVAEVSFKPKINWEGVGAADEAMRAVSTMTAANAVRHLMTGGQSAVSEKDLVDWYAQRKSQEMGLTDEGAADMLNVFGVNVSAVVLRGLLNQAQGHTIEKVPAVIDAAMSSFTNGEFYGVPGGPWHVVVRKTYGMGADIFAAADVEITLKEGQAPIKITPKLNRLQTGAEAARAILRQLQRLDTEVLNDPKAIERAVSADGAMASDRFGIEAFINELGDVSAILPPSDPRYGAISMLQGALGSSTLEEDLPALRTQLDSIKMSAAIRTFGMDDPTLGVTVRVAKPEHNLGGNVDALIVTIAQGQNPREEHISLPSSLSVEQAVIDKLSELRQQKQSASTRVFDPLKNGVNAAMTSAPSDVLKVSDAIVKIARMRGTAEDIRIFKDWLERNGDPDARTVGERLNFTEGLVRIVMMQAFPAEATTFNIDNTLEVATAVGRLAKKQGTPAQAQIFRVWLAAHQDWTDQQVAAALNLSQAQVMIAKQSIASDAAMLAELQKEHAVNLRAAIEARFAVLKDIEKRGGNKTIDFGAGRELRAEYDAIPDAAPEIIIPKLYDTLDAMKKINPDSPADAAMAGMSRGLRLWFTYHFLLMLRDQLHQKEDKGSIEWRIYDESVDIYRNFIMQLTLFAEKEGVVVEIEKRNLETHDVQVIGFKKDGRLATNDEIGALLGKVTETYSFEPIHKFSDLQIPTQISIDLISNLLKNPDIEKRRQTFDEVVRKIDQGLEARKYSRLMIKWIKPLGDNGLQIILSRGAEVFTVPSKNDPQKVLIVARAENLYVMKDLMEVVASVFGELAVSDQAMAAPADAAQVSRGGVPIPQGAFYIGDVNQSVEEEGRMVTLSAVIKMPEVDARRIAQDNVLIFRSNRNGYWQTETFKGEDAYRVMAVNYKFTYHDGAGHFTIELPVEREFEYTFATKPDATSFTPQWADLPNGNGKVYIKNKDLRREPGTGGIPIPRKAFYIEHVTAGVETAGRTVTLSAVLAMSKADAIRIAQDNVLFFHSNRKGYWETELFRGQEEYKNGQINYRFSYHDGKAHFYLDLPVEREFEYTFATKPDATSFTPQWADLPNGNGKVYILDQRPAGFDVDQAQAVNNPGGIDMNTANINTNVAGEKINITFDKAMLENFKRGDFTGVRPVILNVTPIQSVLPLLGLAPRREDGAA